MSGTPGASGTNRKRPGRKPGDGGRPKGIPNKVTRDVREAIAQFASANVEKMGQWLDAIPDPAKKMDLYLRAIEYHVPKLQRSEITGENGQALEVRLNLISQIADSIAADDE